MPKRLAMHAQRRHHVLHLAAVELVVAGHEEHRHRPAGKALQPVPAGVDVAGQHQHLGPRRGHRVEGLGLEVQVGQQLQLQAASFSSMRFIVAGSSAGSL
jgi:hypothetical protein